MKTYRYKNKNGEWVRSIYPKPTKEEEEAAEGVTALVILVGLIALIVYLSL